MNSSSPLLQSFHELVNNDALRRSRACEALLNHLSESQAQFESIADVRGGGGGGGGGGGSGVGGKVSTVLSSGGALGGRPCCNDLSYAVNRLFRGLSSSNLSSRQGFSVALVEVLVDFEPFISTASVVDGLLRETQTTNKANSKSEQRDAVLGRVVGASALLKAGRLDCRKNEDAAVHAATLISEMIKAAKKRSWLAPAAIENVCAILDNSSYRAWKSHLSAVVIPHIPSEATEWSESELAIVIALDSAHSSWNLTQPTQKSKKSKSDSTNTTESIPVPESVKILRNLLSTSSKDLSLLSSASQSSSTGYPIIHPLWMRLFSRYQSTGVLISSTDTEVTARTPTDVEIDEFSNMWRTLIDDSLCNSNSLGKALSASLFSMIAPLARHNPKVVTAILSPNLVKLMTQTISSNKSSPIFGAFSTAISVCENEFKVTKEIALSALYALSSFGDLNFDRVTRTRTIETLCNTLDVESASEFLKFLLRSVSTPLAGGTEDAEIKADEDADIDISDDKSSAKLSKTDATRLKAADALVSFFKTSEDTQLSTSRSALLLPTLQILSLHTFASLTVTPLQAVNDFALQADLSNFSDCLVAKPEIGAAGRRELRSRVTALIKYATFSSPTSISLNRDRIFTSSMTTVQYLCVVHRIYDLAIASASTGVKIVSALGQSSTHKDSYDDDDEDDDVDENDNDLGDAPGDGESPITVRKRALDVSESLQMIIKIQQDASIQIPQEVARQASAYSSLLLQVCLFLITDSADNADVVRSTCVSINDLVACSRSLLNAVFDSANAMLDSISSKKERSKIIASIKSITDASSACGSDDRGDSHPEALVVFVDTLLSLLENANVSLRDSVKSAARQFFGGITLEAIEPILSLLGSSISSGQGGEDDDEDEQGDDDLDDGENSITLSIGSDDALSSLLGESSSKKRKRSASRPILSTSHLSKTNKKDDNDSDDDGLDNEKEGEFINASPEEKRRLVTEMANYDRMLEHMLRLRRDAKIGGKENKKRALHFRLRALDLLDAAVARLCGEGGNEGDKAFASPVLVSFFIPILNVIRKLSLRSKSSSGASAADSDALVNRMSSVLARATKARFPPLSQSASTPSTAASVFIRAGVDVSSQLRLFNEVCITVRTAPTVQFIDNCVFIVNSILRTMRDDTPAISSPGGNSNNTSLQQPSPSTLKPLVSSLQSVLEGYLCDKTSSKNSVGSLSFFRNIFASFPTLSVRLLPFLALVVNEGKISKAFRLGEAFTCMTSIVQQCSSSWAADLVCDIRSTLSSTKKSKGSSTAMLDSTQPAMSKTVRQVLESTASSILIAITSTLTQIKKQEGDGNKSNESKGNAFLSLKHAREPLDLAKALVKANLVNSKDDEVTKSMLLSIAAIGQISKESIHQLCRGILKDAGYIEENTMMDEEEVAVLPELKMALEEAEEINTDVVVTAQIERKKKKKLKT